MPTVTRAVSLVKEQLKERKESFNPTAFFVLFHYVSFTVLLWELLGQ